ncbi:MAG: hypothetical protein PHW15_02995, partial [Patescibacteria group bacterium]|nr:hypothetical protein [Patescibacteria group bacterium]
EKTGTPSPEPTPTAPENSPVAEEKESVRVKVRKIPVISIRSFLVLALTMIVITAILSFLFYKRIGEVESSVATLKKETTRMGSTLNARLNAVEKEMRESFKKITYILTYMYKTNHLAVVHGKKINDIIEMLFKRAWKDDWLTGKRVMEEYLRTGRQDLWDMTMKRLSAEQAKELLGVELPEIFQPNTPQTGTW